MSMASLLHRFLTSPPTMQAKGLFRDLWWTVRGRYMARPVIRPGIRTVLFVCQGNICRSPFAAALMRQMLAAAGRSDITCGSAGIRATQAARPPGLAEEAAARFGVSLADHTPVQLTRALMGEYDLVVAMEAKHATQMLTLLPSAAGRLVLLPLVGGEARSGYARYNIADPFGHPRAAFDLCYEQIVLHVSNLIASLHETNACTGRGACRSGAPRAIRPMSA